MTVCTSGWMLQSVPAVTVMPEPVTVQSGKARETPVVPPNRVGKSSEEPATGLTATAADAIVAVTAAAEAKTMRFFILEPLHANRETARTTARTGAAARPNLAGVLGRTVTFERLANEKLLHLQYIQLGR